VTGLALGSSGGVTASRTTPLPSTHSRTWLGGAVAAVLSRAVKVRSVGAPMLGLAAVNSVAVRRSLARTAITVRASSRLRWRVSAEAVARW
jgi:hypothetical protein